MPPLMHRLLGLRDFLIVLCTGAQGSSHTPQKPVTRHHLIPMHRTPNGVPRVRSERTPRSVRPCPCPTLRLALHHAFRKPVHTAGHRRASRSHHRVSLRERACVALHVPLLLQPLTSAMPCRVHRPRLLSRARRRLGRTWQALRNPGALLSRGASSPRP